MQKQPRYFFCYNHQGKADVLIQALTARGWELTRRPAQAEFILSDLDIPPRLQSLESYRQRGKKIFLYPHAARPSLFYDFTGFSAYHGVSANFVPAQGHVDILQAIDAQYTFEIIGWYMCPLRAFQPRTEYRNVLFAPIHPNSDGSLSDADKRINRETFKKLIALVRSGDITVKVRYIRDLEQNGLWAEPGIDYVQVEPRISITEMDAFDLVISHQTFAHLAVARGLPTIMMGENLTPRFGSPLKGELRYALSWEKYKHLLMYPYDILAEADTLNLFRRAITSDCEVLDWKQRLIGEPFRPRNFVQRVEAYL